jgi:hypothetical protein
MPHSGLLLALLCTLAAVASAASPVPMLGYSQAGITFLTPEHRTVRVWTPDTKQLQCAQILYSSNRTDVVLLMLDSADRTDWLLRYSYNDGSLVADPLQVHGNVADGVPLSSQPTQRMTLIGNGAITLLYSPAGKTLLRYQTDSQLFEGVVRTGPLDALLSSRISTLSSDEMVWLAAEGWLSAYRVSNGVVSFGMAPVWRRPVSGRVKYLTYELDDSVTLSAAVLQLNGAIELWQMDALSGQNLRSLQQIDCGCVLTSAQMDGYTFSIQPSTLIAQAQTQWPSVTTTAERPELSVPLRGSFLLPYTQMGMRFWRVVGGDPQILSYHSGQWTATEAFSRAALSALAQQGNVRRLDRGVAVLLDWSRLVLTQQGYTLSVYSLESEKYVGYWALQSGLSKLLDGYNRHALLSNADGTQLAYLTDSKQLIWSKASVGTSSEALGQTPVSTILCGTYRACNLYANGVVEIYYDAESSSTEPRGKMVILPSQSVPQLANPRRLLFDEKHSSVVLVSTTEGMLHISRVALPDKYSIKVAKFAMSWGPVHSLALSVGAQLPPMDITSADGELMVLGNGSSVYREHYGHAAWSVSEESTMAAQPQWRFLRGKYYRYNDERSINTIIALAIVGVCTLSLLLPLCALFLCCMCKICSNGTCRPVVWRSFQPLYHNDTRYYWLLNPLRKLVSCCCCCTSERAQLRIDSCFMPNDGSMRAQEMSAVSLLRGENDVTLNAFGTDSPLHPSRDASGAAFDLDRPVGRAPKSPPPPPPLRTQQTHAFPDAIGGDSGLGLPETSSLLAAVDSDDEGQTVAAAARPPRSNGGIPMPFGQGVYENVDLNRKP